MSEATASRLYSLLPELYRWRDEQQGKPLQALLTILERELHTLEADSEAMYDNWFIQTCDNWVVPYLADLLSIRDQVVQIDYLPFTQRRRVANTLAYRRRKGTVAVLEQVLWDVTNWHVRAVEFYQLLATTQHVQHLQHDQVVSVSLKDMAALAALESPFSVLPRSSDIRSAVSSTTTIETTANQPVTHNPAPRTTNGTYNPHNLGLFFWRLRPYPVNRGFPKAYSEQNDDQRAQNSEPTSLFTFSPTGHDTQFLNRPQSFLALEQQATAVNMPILITRAELAADLADYRRRYQEQPLEQLPLKSTYYGAERSFNITDLRQINLCTMQGEPQELTALNQGVLTNKLRGALAKTGLVLSQIVYVRPIQPNQQWLLEDTVQGKSYRLENEVGKLYVVCIQQQILPCNIRSTDLSRWQNQALETLQKYYVAEIALFTLDPSFVNDLDAESLSEALREQFGEKGVTLSENAKLTIEEKASKWLITDIWKRYTIRQEAERLQVYDATGTDLVAIDPELGRLAFLDPHATCKAEEIRVDYTYGFSGDVGGGPYPRHFAVDSSWQSYCEILVAVGCTTSKLEEVTQESRVLVAGSVACALALWNRYCEQVADNPRALIRILDNGIYAMDEATGCDKAEPTIRLPEGAEVAIVAEDGVQPTLVGANQQFEIAFQLPKATPALMATPLAQAPDVGEEAPVMDRKLLLSGLRLVGQVVVGEVASPRINALDLVIEHCSLLEGGLDVKLEPENAPALSLSLLQSIVGPLRMPTNVARLEIVESIVDHQLGSQTINPTTQVEYALDGPAATIARTTIFGKVQVEGALQADAVLFTEPVTVNQPAKDGKSVLRYCYLPAGSQVPACDTCLHEDEKPEECKNCLGNIARPVFSSQRYGRPGYAQLSKLSAVEILTGAGKIAEIGVFSQLYQPQRAANIQTMLEEYLPLGLDAGVFHVT